MATAAPRPKGKARKIAYTIMGKPRPAKKSDKERELDQKLVYDEIRYQK